MQFILDQQAQFAADIQKLQESQVETDDRIRKLVDVSLSLAHHVEGLTGHVEEIDRRLASFISETNERFQRLAESQAHTDQRLDTLIDIVRRQAERGNGRQIQQ
ncbi:MAG TPA: hypothetical protein VG206_08800 [Terriglobia bacterium]|nr:hypothetical protein [Terriglobia bacterium]